MISKCPNCSKGLKRGHAFDSPNCDIYFCEECGYKYVELLNMTKGDLKAEIKVNREKNEPVIISGVAQRDIKKGKEINNKIREIEKNIEERERFCRRINRNKEVDNIWNNLTIKKKVLDEFQTQIKKLQGELKEEFKLMRSSEIINKIIDKVFKNRFGEIK